MICPSGIHGGSSFPMTVCASCHSCVSSAELLGSLKPLLIALSTVEFTKYPPLNRPCVGVPSFDRMGKQKSDGLLYSGHQNQYAMSGRSATGLGVEMSSTNAGYAFSTIFP